MFSSSNFSVITWKAYNNDQAPSVDGYKIGKHPNGNDVYIGKGTYSGQTGPGRIQLSPSIGFYYSHSGYERYITTGVQYLVVGSTCNCSWVQNSGGKPVPNAVAIQDASVDNFVFWIGRGTLPGGVTIGKIVNSMSSIWYCDAAGNDIYETFYEVLACV